ncbi:MAG: nucleotide exchange factor GrpE [Bacteroidota bacterium]
MSKNKVNSESEEPIDGVNNATESTNENPEQEAVAAETLATENVDVDTQLQQERDKYLRLYSEFENFRRRTAKDRLDWMQTASKDVLVSMLPVVDDFERALKAVENLSETEKKAVEGFDLIHKKMVGIFTKVGLKPMESIGQPFDAEIHEAITQFPAPSEDLKGKVIDEVEKGYYLNDKVIRFAKVVVGN